MNGEQKHANMWVAGFDGFGGIQAVHIRHGDVHQHNVRLQPSGQVEGLPAVGSAEHRVPGLFEVIHHQLDKIGFVVHNQDGGWVG